MAVPKTIIQRVLSYSGCRGNGKLLMFKPRAAIFISPLPTCVTSDQRFSFPQLFQFTDCTDWQIWAHCSAATNAFEEKTVGSQTRGSTEMLVWAQPPRFFFFSDDCNLPAALQKAFTDNWDGCDEKENHDLKEEYELILVIFKLCFWKWVGLLFIGLLGGSFNNNMGPAETVTVPNLNPFV